MPTQLHPLQNRPPQNRTDGRLHLCFTRPSTTEPTRLQVQTQTPPLRVVRAFPIADQAVLTHLHNVSGGVLGGDQLQLVVDVQQNARVQLTSTGATRVYRHRPAYADATQTTHFQVATGGLLEYLPDPLIPYAQARYRQQTQIELADNAGLFYWEMLTPGREAHQESFAYDEVRLNLDIVAAGRPIVLERMRLTPASQPLTTLARLGSYPYFATFYLCRVGWPASDWLALEKTLAAMAHELTQPDTILWGVSTLTAHGLSIRALSVNSRAIVNGLLHFWQVAKQAIYGLDAIPPRKVY